MNRTELQLKLKNLVNPRHMVFIGGRQLTPSIRFARRLGFEGDIFIVNPHRSEIADIRTVPTIADLPKVPDAAFIAVSPERTLLAVEQLAELGVPGGVAHATGFAELGEEGQARQRALLSAAKDMALIGPNTMGFINGFDRVAFWGNDSHAAVVEGAGAAVISQSGAFIFGITNTEQGFPLGYGLSVGNEAVVKTSDCVEFALTDPRVKAIGLYQEGITDGPALSAALGHALERGVPIVLLYGGGGLAGARQAVSHTGNLTASDDFWGALIERYGLIRVKTPKEMVETLKMLSLTARPTGNRLFVATYSGATGVLLSDQAQDYGLELPAISPAAAESVRPRLPPVVPIANPLDLNLSWTGGEGITLDNSEAISDGLLDLAAMDADILAFMLDVPRSGTGIETPWMPTLEAMIKLRQKSNLPTVVATILHDGLSPEHRHQLAAGGVAPLLGFADSLTAMGLAAQYWKRREEIRRAGASPEPLASIDVTAPAPDRRLHPGVHNEWDGKKLLAGYGIAIPQGRVCSPADGRPYSGDLSFPVVLKILSNRVPHKARHGGVALNIRDGAELKQRMSAMAEAVEGQLAGEIPYFLVEEMVAHVASELLVGLKRHQQLGYVLVIGRGGVDAEHLGETKTLLLPLSAADRSALNDWCARLLGARLFALAEPGLNSIIHGVETMAHDLSGHLEELDINPLIIDADGNSVAVDALVVAR